MENSDYTKEEAWAIVQKHLNEQQLAQSTPIELAITKAIDKSYGWVFFYDATGILRRTLCGNVPILFMADSGKMYDLSFNWQESLLQFETGLSEQEK